MGLGLGEGGVVAAFAADQGAAGAAAARRHQVAVAFAVEVGRPGQAADQPVGAVAAVELVGAGAGLEQVVLGAAFDDVVAFAAGDAHVLRAGERAFDPQAVVAGAEVGGQPAGGALRFADDLLGVAADVVAARSDRDPLGRADAEGVRGFVEGDRGEDVVAAAADDLQPSPAPLGAVELHVGGGLRRSFLAAGGGVALGALAGVAALAADQFVGAAAADERVVAGAAVDPVVAFVADQRVAEGRAFDVLDPEEPVVAVAARLALGEVDPDAGALAAGDVGREGGDVVLRPGRRPCGRSRSRRARGRSCRGRRSECRCRGRRRPRRTRRRRPRPCRRRGRRRAGRCRFRRTVRRCRGRRGSGRRRRRRRSGRCRGCRRSGRFQARPRSRRVPASPAARRRRSSRRSSPAAHGSAALLRLRAFPPPRARARRTSPPARRPRVPCPSTASTNRIDPLRTCR